MEKLIKSRSFSIPTVHLYYEDLSDLISLFKSSSKRLSIVSDDSRFDSLEDLKKSCGESINDLELTGHDPHVSLRFKRDLLSSGIWIYSEGGEADSLFLRVCDRLQQNKSFISIIFPSFIGKVAVFFLICASWWGPKIASISISLFLKLFVLFILLALIPSLFQNGHLYSLTLIKKSERKSFWKRNQDAILVGVISAIVSAFVTLFIIRISK